MWTCGHVDSDNANLYSCLSISNSYLYILVCAYTYVRIGTLSSLYIYFCCLSISSLIIQVGICYGNVNCVILYFQHCCFAGLLVE